MEKKAQIDFDDILNNPIFWLLGGGAAIATLAGYIWGKNLGMDALPLWQIVVMVIVEFIAAAFFASRE